MSCCNSNRSVETRCPAATLTDVYGDRKSCCNSNTPAKLHHVTLQYSSYSLQHRSQTSPTLLITKINHAQNRQICILFRTLRSMDSCIIYIYLIWLPRTCFLFCSLHQSSLVATSSTRNQDIHISTAVMF